MKKIKKYLIFGIIICFLVYIFITLLDAIIYEKFYYSKKSISTESLALLHIDTLDVKDVLTRYSKKNTVVSSFQYKDTLDITTFRIHITPTMHISDAITCVNDLTDLSSGGIFAVVDNKMTKLEYVHNYDSPAISSIAVHTVRVNICQRIIDNDSTVALFLKDCYGFGFKFNNSAHQNIYLQAKPHRSNDNKKTNEYMNMAILFKKQKDYIYTYVVYKNNYDANEINENTIINLLENKR